VCVLRVSLAYSSCNSIIVGLFCNIMSATPVDEVIEIDSESDRETERTPPSSQETSSHTSPTSAESGGRSRRNFQQWAPHYGFGDCVGVEEACDMGPGGGPAAAGPPQRAQQAYVTFAICRICPKYTFSVALRRIETVDGDIAAELRLRMQRAWRRKDPSRPRRAARGPYKKSRRASPVCNAEWQAVTDESELGDYHDMQPDADPEAFVGIQTEVHKDNTEVENTKEDIPRDYMDAAAERGTKRAQSPKVMPRRSALRPRESVQAARAGWALQEHFQEVDEGQLLVLEDVQFKNCCLPLAVARSLEGLEATRTAVHKCAALWIEGLPEHLRNAVTKNEAKPGEMLFDDYLAKVVEDDTSMIACLVIPQDNITRVWAGRRAGLTTSRVIILKYVPCHFTSLLPKHGDPPIEMLLKGLPPVQAFSFIGTAELRESMCNAQRTS
ncbi:unnamed protein product, partial [Symbiodinium necroappetens]